MKQKDGDDAIPNLKNSLLEFRSEVVKQIENYEKIIKERFSEENISKLKEAALRLQHAKEHKARKMREKQ